MILSLRARVLVMVLCLNAIVFGAGGVVLFLDLAGDNQRLVEERTNNLLRSLASTHVRPGLVNATTILQWPWEWFEDAILVDDTFVQDASGRIGPSGVYLNPTGRSRRPPGFDDQEVLRAIERAMREKRVIEGVAGGRALPILVGQDAWGGWWSRTSSHIRPLHVVRLLSPWFLLSTLVLTGGSYLALRRLVLDPVDQLAHGARRVRAGDFSVRLTEPRRKDEVADLVRSFNAMTQRVEGFNERLEDEVRRATDQARRAEAAAMTQRRLAAMGELAAGIAHEINNPLGGLLNAVEFLRRDDLPAEKRERYIDLLARGLERIGETVDRLRRFTPRQPQDGDVDLAAVVRDACDLVRHRAERLGVALVAAAPEEGPVLRGSRNELGQCVLNLLANALDALEEGGTRDPGGPRIRASVEGGDGVRVVVEDNGPGVEPQELARVSDLFYTTKEVGKGTGLGLALVHNVIRAHDGGVLLTSEKGRGFRVELSFPASRLVREGSPS